MTTMKMTNKNRSRNAVFAAILTGLLCAVSAVSTAEEMPEEMAEKVKELLSDQKQVERLMNETEVLRRNEALIRTIDELVETKIKEAQGEDALSAVLDDLSAKEIALDPSETVRSAAVIELQKRKALKAYPTPDWKLTEEYSPDAERMYPLYQKGQTVTLVYQLHGKSFTVSGPFYRGNSRYVWVGSKQILRSSIFPEHNCRFDEKTNRAMRNQYIQSKIGDYHRRRRKREQNLLSQNNDLIEAYRGKVKVNEKWLSVRAATEQKYAAVFGQQEQKIVTTIQTVKEQQDDLESYTMCCLRLESIIRDYPRHSHAAEAKALLEKIKREYPIKLASREAVRRIVVADGSSPTAQIVIRKVINPNNEYMLIIFPLDRKKDAVELYEYTEFMKSFRQQHFKTYRALEAMGGGPLDSQTRSELKELNNLQTLGHIKNFLSQLRSIEKIARFFFPNQSSYSLSDIQSPVILFAAEKIKVRNVYGELYDIWQGWYLEYTPGQSIEWRLE